MSSSDHIQIVRVISRSSIATVWEGYDTRLGRKVLGKTLHPQLVRHEDLRRRFMREAQAVASLAHPNVVRLYELRESDEDLSLIFEFVEGSSLRDLLKEHKVLPLGVATSVASEILAGLSAAHEKGIVHRDLKPSNVLLSERGEVKIADFGLAIVRDLPRLTQTDAVPGTPDYMAPEQVAGGELKPQTDLFALGLMLFEMLTGLSLIQGATLKERLHKVVNFQLPRFSDYREKIPSEMARILARLLDPRPSKRFESAEVAGQALGVVTKDWHLPAASILLRDLASQPRPEERAQVRPVLPRQARRGRWFAFRAVFVLFFVALLGIIYFMLRPPGPPEQIPRWDWSLAKAFPDTIQPLPSQERDTVPRRTVIVGPETLKFAREVRPVAATARLMIRCQPWTEVVVDGKIVGVTPIDTLALLVGSHRIVLENDSIPVVVDTAIILEEAELTLLSVDLYDFAEPARLQIFCTPWADVIVDGKKVGRTPFEDTRTLRAGPHRFVFENEYFPVIVDTQITLKGGERATLSVNLYDHVGVILVKSVKPWVYIRLDGALVDTTPRQKPYLVTLGEEHTVRLENPNYPPWEKSFFFTEADTVEIRVDLTAQP